MARQNLHYEIASNIQIVIYSTLVTLSLFRSIDSKHYFWLKTRCSTALITSFKVHKESCLFVCVVKCCNIPTPGFSAHFVVLLLVLSTHAWQQGLGSSQETDHLSCQDTIKVSHCVGELYQTLLLTRLKKH